MLPVIRKILDKVGLVGTKSQCKQDLPMEIIGINHMEDLTWPTTNADDWVREAKARMMEARSDKQKDCGALFEIVNDTSSSKCSVELDEYLTIRLTRREQEIPHLYRWWDELRLTRRPI